MKLHYRCNLVAGIAAALFGLIVILLIPGQISLGYGEVKGITPRTLPYALGGICVVLGAVLIFQSLVLRKDTVRELDVKKELKAICYMLVLLAYALLFKVNFILASIFLGVATLLFLRSKKPLYYGIVIAVVLGLYALFTQVLHVRM